MSRGRRVVVIGGGILGLAVAERLLRLDPSAAVTVVEKEQDWARHQTGRNSGVLHSGLYYPPGSRKASWCRTGATSNNTTCGEITGKNGGLVTNIFSCQGDSGGPLFSESDHKAYGILQGGQGVPCSGTVSFSPLSKILAAASAKYNITYSLITSP